MRHRMVVERYFDGVRVKACASPSSSQLHRAWVALSLPGLPPGRFSRTGLSRKGRPRFAPLLLLFFHRINHPSISLLRRPLKPSSIAPEKNSGPSSGPLPQPCHVRPEFLMRFAFYPAV